MSNLEDKESWLAWDYKNKKWIKVTWDDYGTEPWCHPDCWERAHCDDLDVGHTFCGTCEHGVPKHHRGSCDTCVKSMREKGTLIYASDLDDILEAEIGVEILLGR